MPKYVGPKIDIERKRGFILVTEASERTGEQVGSIYRWIKDGKVECETVGSAKFVSIAGLIKLLGPAYTDKLADAFAAE